MPRDTKRRRCELVAAASQWNANNWALEAICSLTADMDLLYAKTARTKQKSNDCKSWHRWGTYIQLEESKLEQRRSKMIWIGMVLRDFSTNGTGWLGIDNYTEILRGYALWGIQNTIRQFTFETEQTRTRFSSIKCSRDHESHVQRKSTSSSKK